VYHVGVPHKLIILKVDKNIVWYPKKLSSFLNKLVHNEDLMMTPRVETCRHFNYKIKLDVLD